MKWPFAGLADVTLVSEDLADVTLAIEDTFEDESGGWRWQKLLSYENEIFKWEKKLFEKGQRSEKNFDIWGCLWADAGKCCFERVLRRQTIVTIWVYYETKNPQPRKNQH